MFLSELISTETSYTHWEGQNWGQRYGPRLSLIWRRSAEIY